METLNKPIENAYWVVEGHFLAGEHPFHGSEEESHRRLQAFFEAGFEAFFDLTMPDERPSYRAKLQELASQYRRPVAYYAFPIPDFGVLSYEEMCQLLDVLEGTLQRGLRTYLHCLGGIGRTGMVVGCYLVRRGLSGAEALQELQRRWQSVPKSRFHPDSPESEAQRQFVLNFRS
uniref:Dual specificity protein phosphatase n=1 Tax=uncultured Chloroflexota bacterium TaxID=166587 RepID=H5SBH7_9CHLR|nr:dual specificity protein phosphatase [uncultured Chloroflexota bacterium]